MRTKKKIPTALSVAVVLLCLVLVSAHFTSGMYARYTTRAQGSDASRAAEFIVSASQSKAEVAAGENGYVITVKNDSKVPVSYESVITFDDEADMDQFAVDAHELTGILSPNESKEIPVVFVLAGDEPGGDGSAPFTVTVTFTQID